MKVIAGLGNPGEEYGCTRHNVGFMFVDQAARSFGFSAWQTKKDALVAEGRVGGEKVVLVKPLTFMNESGRAIGPLLSWYKLSAEDLTVVYDDMDIPVGTVRIRKKGSAGGHNGMKSLLYHVGEEEFARFRLGIGRPHLGRSVVQHVLSPFTKEERLAVDRAIFDLIPAVECLVEKGIDFTMNRYNPKKQKKGKDEGVNDAGE